MLINNHLSVGVTSGQQSLQGVAGTEAQKVAPTGTTGVPLMGQFEVLRGTTATNLFSGTTEPGVGSGSKAPPPPPPPPPKGGNGTVSAIESDGSVASMVKFALGVKGLAKMIENIAQQERDTKDAIIRNAM